MFRLFIFLVIIGFGLFLFQGFGLAKNTDYEKLPGDVFYFLDRTWEWAQVNLFTLSDERKIELKMSFLEERLSELKTLKEKKELTQEKFQKQIDNYNNTVNRVNEDIEKLKAVKSDVDYLAEKAKIMTDKNKSVIENISKNIPEGTENALDTISNFGKSLYSKVKELF